MLRNVFLVIILWTHSHSVHCSLLLHDSYRHIPHGYDLFGGYKAQPLAASSGVCFLCWNLLIRLADAHCPRDWVQSESLALVGNACWSSLPLLLFYWGWIPFLFRTNKEPWWGTGNQSINQSIYLSIYLQVPSLESILGNMIEGEESIFETTDLERVSP